MSGASARSADDGDNIPPRELLLENAEALAIWLRARLLAPDAPPADPIKDAALLNDPRLLGRVPRQAAVLAPLYARNGRPYLLFTQRSADLSTHSGEISFPGGSRDPVDRSLAQTALRESQE